MKRNPCQNCNIESCKLIGAPEYNHFVEKEKNRCPCHTCLVRAKCTETCEFRRGHIRRIWRLVHESKGFPIKQEADRSDE